MVDVAPLVLIPLSSEVRFVSSSSIKPNHPIPRGCYPFREAQIIARRRSPNNSASKKNGIRQRVVPADESDSWSGKRNRCPKPVLCGPDRRGQQSDVAMILKKNFGSTVHCGKEAGSLR